MSKWKRECSWEKPAKDWGGRSGKAKKPSQHGILGKVSLQPSQEPWSVNYSSAQRMLQLWTRRLCFILSHLQALAKVTQGGHIFPGTLVLEVWAKQLLRTSSKESKRFGPQKQSRHKPAEGHLETVRGIRGQMDGSPSMSTTLRMRHFLSTSSFIT